MILNEPRELIWQHNLYHCIECQPYMRGCTSAGFWWRTGCLPQIERTDYTQSDRGTPRGCRWPGRSLVGCSIGQTAGCPTLQPVGMPPNHRRNRMQLVFPSTESQLEALPPAKQAQQSYSPSLWRGHKSNCMQEDWNATSDGPYKESEASWKRCYCCWLNTSSKTGSDHGRWYPELKWLMYNMCCTCHTGEHHIFRIVRCKSRDVVHTT